LPRAHRRSADCWRRNKLLNARESPFCARRRRAADDRLFEEDPEPVFTIVTRLW
jgi:hypothetical protein